MKLEVTTNTDQSLLELQALAHEFTSQLPLHGTKNVDDEISSLSDQYADQFYDLITRIQKSGADEESISTYFNKGATNAANEFEIIRYKSTPCWDTYQNAQTNASVAAAGCMLVAGALSGPIGVGGCLVAYSAAMTAAEINYNRCIERTYQ